MWQLLPLLLVPMLIAGIAAATSKGKITGKELLLLEAIMVALLTFGFMMARWGAMRDTELWNGRISEKLHGTMGCCHCHQECDTCTSTDSQGRTTTSSCNCRTVCAHSHDYYWSLAVSTGDKVGIRDCEPWESNVPKAWAAAYVGEPASVEHGYNNYLLADPDSVLLKSATAKGTVPQYPRVNHYYKTTRILTQGVPVNVGLWDAELDEINADLGHNKQVNVIVLFTKSADSAYAQVVEEQWLYGKKNDLIFIFGVPDGDVIDWADVVTISRVEMLKVKARDMFVGFHTDDYQEILSVVRRLVKEDFTRTPMAEFEYLASAAKPSSMVLGLLYVLAFAISIGGSIYMHEKEYRPWRRW